MVQVSLARWKSYIDKLLEDEPELSCTADVLLLEAEALLLGKRPMPVPDRLTINKMGTLKKRVIYVYRPYEKILMKIINQLISSLDLDLSRHCYSFRKHLTSRDAIGRVCKVQTEQYACIRLDIQNYFNAIPTQALVLQLPDKLKSHPVYGPFLSRLILDTRVYADGVLINDSTKGAMAGTPLGPTLANIYLTAFDKEQTGQTRFYARYSDDIIAFVEKERLDEVQAAMVASLEGYGLDVNLKKSGSLSPGQPWEFLGIEYDRGKVDLSLSSMVKIKGKISREARRLYRWRVKKEVEPEVAARVLIRKIQRKFFGHPDYPEDFTWARWFFPIINCSQRLKEIDEYFQSQIRYLATGRHTKQNYKVFPYQKLRALGYVPLVSAYYQRPEGCDAVK